MLRFRTCFKWGPTLVLGLAIMSLALAIFAGLAIDVVESQSIWFDAVILNGLFTMASPTLTLIMQAITTTATYWVIGPILILLTIFWWNQRRADIIALVASLVGSFMLNQVIKSLLERARPTLHPHLVTASGYSFPSGHSTAAIAFYGVLAYLLARHAAPEHRIWYYVSAAVWILLVGLSRNYLEVHFPSDVLAAFAVTLPWVMAVIFAHQCYARQVPGQEDTTALA